MNIPERIWKNPRLDVAEKLIIGVILDGGDTTTADIAKAIGATPKKVSQRINRLRQCGYITVEKREKTLHLEVTA